MRQQGSEGCSQCTDSGRRQGQVHFRMATEYTGNWSGCVQASSGGCAPGQRRLARQMQLCSVRLPSSRHACAGSYERALVGAHTLLRVVVAARCSLLLLAASWHASTAEGCCSLLLVEQAVDGGEGLVQLDSNLPLEGVGLGDLHTWRYDMSGVQERTARMIRRCLAVGSARRGRGLQAQA